MDAEVCLKHQSYDSCLKQLGLNKNHGTGSISVRLVSFSTLKRQMRETASVWSEGNIRISPSNEALETQECMEVLIFLPPRNVIIASPELQLLRTPP